MTADNAIFADFSQDQAIKNLQTWAVVFLKIMVMNKSIKNTQCQQQLQQEIKHHCQTVFDKKTSFYLKRNIKDLVLDNDIVKNNLKTIQTLYLINRYSIRFNLNKKEPAISFWQLLKEKIKFYFQQLKQILWCFLKPKQQLIITPVLKNKPYTTNTAIEKSLFIHYWIFTMHIAWNDPIFRLQVNHLLSDYLRFQFLFSSKDLPLNIDLNSDTFFILSVLSPANLSFWQDIEVEYQLLNENYCPCFWEQWVICETLRYLYQKEKQLQKLHQQSFLWIKKILEKFDLLNQPRYAEICISLKINPKNITNKNIEIPHFLRKHLLSMA